MMFFGTPSDMTLSVRASGLSERKKVVNNVTGRIQEATMNGKYVKEKQNVLYTP